MKRFHQELSECSRPVKIRKHYACLEGKVIIETKGQKHPINILLDSGSNIFLMNQDTAWRLEIPTEARDSQPKITTFHRETAPTGGIFYTHSILFESAPTVTEAWYPAKFQTQEHMTKSSRSSDGITDTPWKISQTQVNGSLKKRSAMLIQKMKQ